MTVCPREAGYPLPPRSGNNSVEGDDWSRTIRGYTDGANSTAKVGTFTSNHLGIHDIGGTVWERRHDRFHTEQKGRAMTPARIVDGHLFSSSDCRYNGMQFVASRNEVLDFPEDDIGPPLRTQATLAEICTAR